MNHYITKYKIWVKIISIVLVCLFTVDTLSWAAPTHLDSVIFSPKDTLAAWTSFKALTDAGIENPFKVHAQAVEGAKLLLKGVAVNDISGFLKEQGRKVIFLEDAEVNQEAGIVRARFRVRNKNEKDITFEIRYQKGPEGEDTVAITKFITNDRRDSLKDGLDTSRLQRTERVDLVDYVKERAEAHEVISLTIARYDDKGEPLSLSVASEETIRNAIKQKNALKISLREMPRLVGNVYIQTNEFLFALSSQIAKIFTKTSQEETNIRTAIYKILKDAFRHGNRLDFELPILLYIELDDHERVKSIDCFDAKSSRELSITEEREAEILGGGDQGSRGISQVKSLGWQYERKTITTKSNIAATQVRLVASPAEEGGNGFGLSRIMGIELFIGGALTIWTGLGIFFALALVPLAVVMIYRIYKLKQRGPHVHSAGKSSANLTKDITQSADTSSPAAEEYPLSEQKRDETIRTFFGLLNSLENLRIAEWWYTYADLILKMFYKGLIFEERANIVVDLALKDLEKKDAISNYADLVIDMLEKRLIKQKDDPRLIAALEILQRKTSWKNYANLILSMLDKGFITEKDDPGLSVALEKIKDCNEWIIYGELIISMFERGFILQKKAKKEIALALKMIKKLRSRQPRYSSLIFRMLDKGFIDRETADSELKELLEYLEGIPLWYEYAGLILKMLDKGLIERPEAEKKLRTPLERLKEKKLWYWYTDLIIRMRDKGFIVEKAAKTEAETALKELKRKKEWDKYADLVIKIFDKAEASFLNKERAKARDINAPSFGYYLKTLELARIFGLSQEALTRIIEEAKGYISLIDETNRRVPREEQKIDLINLQLYRAQGLANLQIISPKLAKELIYNHCQRGFLPLLEDDIKAASLLNPVYVVRLKRCLLTLQGKYPSSIITPAFMMQIINFANASQHLELGIDEFTRALDADTTEDVIFNLGRGLIKFLADSFGIKVDLDNAESTEALLKDWNLAYLGSMVSASHRWSKKDAVLFNLIIRTALEGKFHALLYPEDYPEAAFEHYTEEERDLIARVRAYNNNFIKQLKELKINTEVWLHPERITSELTVKDEAYARNWQVILKDFRSAFMNFEEWLENCALPDKDGFKKQLQGAKKSIAGFNRLLTSEMPDITKYYNLLSQGESLNRLYKLLDKIQHQHFAQGLVPPEVADLINVIQEIQDFDISKIGKKSKPVLRMRFWKRQVGRDSVIANQVRSCTRLEQNARAIFEFLPDLGTIYLILEDPDTGQEKGYVRFFLGLNKHHEPTIFLDSADGSANAGHYEPIPEARSFIEEFAAKCNIEHVVSRETEIVSKVGDALTEDYFHHSKIIINAYEPSETELLALKKEDTQHFEAFKLKGERNAVNVAEEKAKRRGMIDDPKTKRIFEDKEQNYDFEMVCTELTELAEGLGVSEGEIGALLHKAFSSLKKYRIDTSSLKGKRILIALLEENASQYLFEDCENNKFIGINRTFLKIVEEIAKTDSELAKRIGSVLLVLGVAHELRHEVELKDEDIKFDSQLLDSLLEEFSVPLDELRNILVRYIVKTRGFKKLIREENEEHYRIAVSIGGTKIGVSGISGDGTIFGEEELRWREKLGPQATTDEILDALDALINSVRSKAPARPLIGIGIAFGGPGDYERGIIFSKNLPFTPNFPLKTCLEARLEVPVIIMHDAAAAIMGETSKYGTLADASDATAIVIGTGISAGLKREGKPWYGRGALGEIGWSLWYHETSQGPSYSYDGDLSYKELMQGIETHKKTGDISLEERLAGPYLARRFVHFILDKFGKEKASQYFNKSVEELIQRLDAKEAKAEREVLNLLTEKALTPGDGRDFLEASGRELGTALAIFIAHHKDKALAHNVVLVGGISEHLGKPVTTGEREDLWLKAVRDSVYEELKKLGVDFALASHIRDNIVRSSMTYRREFFAFIPQKYTSLPIHTAKSELLPRNERIIIFSPHPDDDVITMAATIKELVGRGNKVTVVYLVTGEHAVRNDDLQAQERYKTIRRIFMQCHEGREPLLEEDSELWRQVRTKVREDEARQAVKPLGSVETVFLKLPYYDTRPSFSERDSAPVQELFERIQPQHFFYSAEEDPHGAHGIGQEVIRKAFAKAHLNQEVKIWGYRGAYEEWPLEEAEHLVIVPFDNETMQLKINSIKAHASQLNPMFPGTDKREFYERARSRNRMTGKLLEALCYFPTANTLYAEVFRLFNRSEFLASTLSREFVLNKATTAQALVDYVTRSAMLNPGLQAGGESVASVSIQDKPRSLDRGMQELTIYGNKGQIDLIRQILKEEYWRQRVRSAVFRERPHLKKALEDWPRISDIEKELVRREFYRIRYGHFRIWDISGALSPAACSYFEGSYITALQRSFPELELEELGFGPVWNEGPEKGMESVKYIIKKENPELYEKVEKWSNLLDFEQDEVREEFYKITRGHFIIWGLNCAMDRKFSPYFGNSYITCLLETFPELELDAERFKKRPRLKRFVWKRDIKRAVANVRTALKKNRPDLMRKIDGWGGLSLADKALVKEEFYKITRGHFDVWGLSGAMNEECTPDFKGSLIVALQESFHELGLEELGFGPIWEKGIEKGRESVRYIIRKENPILYGKLENWDQLEEAEKEEIRKEFYKITSSHFEAWGLRTAMSRKNADYFKGSYMVALRESFKELGLKEEGFKKSGRLDVSKEKSVLKEKLVEFDRLLLEKIGISRQEETRLSNENNDEEYLLMHNTRHLEGHSINMYIDLSAIPKEEGQLYKNIETLALLIARNKVYGFDVRYILENDRADLGLKKLKERLNTLNVTGLNPDELFILHPEDKAIKIMLRSVENVEKTRFIEDWEFIVGLKDDETKEGVSLPNYSSAMTIGLTQAALRVIVESVQGNDLFKKFDSIDVGTKGKIYERLKEIYKRFKTKKPDRPFTMDSLKFMVIGCSKNKLDYAAIFALPPIVKDLVERVNEFHRNIHIILQNA